MGSQTAQTLHIERKRHSYSGITSCVLAVLALLLFEGCYLYWLYCASRYGDTDSFGDPIVGRNDENLIFAGFVLNGLLFLVSAGFGIHGLRQRDKSKVYPVLGTLFSALTLLLIVARLVWLFVHYG